MKLFVTDDNNIKHYLNIKASSKRRLLEKIGNSHFLVNGNYFSIQQVTAEKNSEATPVSMVLGGALGIVGGVYGVILGGVLGGLFGKGADEKEDAQVLAFNEEQI